MSCKYFVLACCLATLCLWSTTKVTTVQSRPSEPAAPPSEAPVDPSEYYGNLSPETIRKIQKCDRDMDMMELCMRCAKVTKSQIVYPMCCDNEDNVKDWCHDYIYFGTRK